MTLISHSHRFIYLKTVKTAGTTAEVALEPLCAPGSRLKEAGRETAIISGAGVVAPRRERRGSDQWWSHMPAQAVKARTGEQVWDGYLKVTSVRNPFDKLVSWFFYAAPPDRIEKQKARGDAALQRFFERWIMRRGEGVIDRDIYTLNGEVCAQRLIRFETLEQDLTDLLRTLNAPAAGRGLPWMKRNRARSVADYRQIYTGEARRHAEAMFAFELNCFGYDF